MIYLEIIVIVLGGKFLYMIIIRKTLSKNGITTIEYKVNSTSHRFYQYTKEEQFIKNICSYIDNDIKYYMKQCFTYKRLEFNRWL